MQQLSVAWHEGQFLRPQHFQAAERYLFSQWQTSQGWSLPFRYGVYSLEISREALANNQLEIQSIRALLRDGTVIDLGSEQQPDRIHLKEAIAGLTKAFANLSDAFDAQPNIRVYLGIPKLRLGRANLSPTAGDDNTRFVETRVSVADENSGAKDQELLFRSLNVRILLSVQDLTGYDLLPLLQLTRVGDSGAVPQIDQSYIPPVLTLDAFPTLGRGIVRAIYDLTGHKIEFISQQLVSRGVGFDSRYPGDLDRLMMLTLLNSTYAALGAIAFTRGVHPLEAYTEICRAIGAISVFAPSRRVEELPPYDHEDLGGVFTELKRRYELLLNMVHDYAFEQRFFVGVGLGMQVTLEPKWFNSDWQWFIGVRKGELTTDECRNLLSPGELDWKLGSSRQVEFLFQHRAEGLDLAPVDRPIRALPGDTEWLYYEIARKDTPAWSDVQLTQTLAMRLKDSLIQNADRLQGERQLQVSFRGKPVALQFALFAVPAKT